jgi:tetratricopeptide (TPR) repeat protein
MSKQKVKPSTPKATTSASAKVENLRVEIPEIPYTKRNYWVFLGLLGLSCGLIYWPGFINDFVWDDHFYIVNNRYIQELTWENLQETLTGYMLGNYHPLTMLSLFVEYTLAGARPWVYHLDNLLLHIANSWLVFRLIYRLNPSFLAAAVTSMLFAVHPLHVESVVWAAERKDVLYTLFFLLSFHYYLRFVAENKRSHYVISILLFVCSCLSKGMAVVLPVVLVLTDWLMLKRSFNNKVLLEKAPYFVIALAAGIVSIVAQRSAGADATNVLGLAYSKSERFFFICYGLMFYWVKMLIPTNLYAFYPYPELTGMRKLPGEFYFYFFLLLVLVAGLYWTGRRDARIWWGGLYFFVVILPVAQILPIGSAIVADRYFYVSSVGPLFLMGLFANYLHSRGGVLSKGLPVLGGLVLVAHGALAFQRAKVWETPFTLFSDVLKKYPNDPMVMSNIGWWYYAKKDTLNAINYFEKTKEKNFANADIHFALGQMYFARKDYARTIGSFEEAIKLKPNEMKSVYWMLGTACYYADSYDKAITYSEKAVKDVDQNANAWNVLGLTHTKLGEYDKAEGYYKKAMKVGPQFYDPYVNLGHLYNQKGEHLKEIEYLQKAIKLDPKVTIGYKNIGVAYVAINQPEKAVEYWKKGAAADPKDGTFDYNIALRYALKGQVAEAIEWYKKAARKGDQSAMQLLQSRGVAY